ncbi:MAG: cache domain-containing protein [Candidatus Paceibacterota bacterium]|jgi:hypothetical protein
MTFRIYINERLKRLRTISKREKALIFAFVLTLVIFFISLFFSQKIIYSFSPFIKDEISHTEKSLNQELGYIAEQTKQVAESGFLNPYIEKRDILNILSFLNDEKKNKDLETILVTDKEGVVLTRTETVAEQGDNIFQTTIWGRALSQGIEVASIEKGRLSPLIMVAGQLIKKDGETIGSLFSSYSFDDKYAIKFKERHLDNETHLAFYTREEGIIGSTFKSQETIQLLNAYFGIGSDLIIENLSELEKEVKINDKYYSVKNIIFPGIEESPGGVLIFCQSFHIFQSLGFGISVLLIFLLLEILIYAIFFKNFIDRKKYNIILIVSSLIIFFVTTFVSFYKLDKDSIDLKKPAYIIYNSVIKFEPESDVLDRFFEKRIAIKVLTGGEAINAIEVVANYDPKAVEVLDIITTNSFCRQDFFITKTIDNEKGVVNVACGLPNPGFSEPNGIVAELLIQPLKSGQLSLRFGDETKVLANDGLGTNVLRLAIDGSYNIVSYDDQQNIGEPLTVYSYTHPNSERWYKRKNVQFSWSNIKGVTYRYALNNIADFIPGEENITSKNSLSFDVDKDGIYYFHLLPEKDGGIGTIIHYKIMIDSTPPLFPIIQASHKNIEPGEMVRFDFSGKDELSGIQKGFYVKFDEGVFLPVAPPLYMPFLSAGSYSVVIRAFDKAGNFNDAMVEIKVEVKRMQSLIFMLMNSLINK